MRMVDILRKKRDGGILSEEEIAYVVKGCADESLPDYQLSALLMAICLRGMNEAETLYLTNAMARSGDTLDLSRFGSLSADKHSTGGVGDKTSLIVAPLAAALGVKVAKMSGRGLGHTGGTADKLEAIPGYRLTLTREEFLRQVDEVGLALVGSSENLDPADKRLYALRDVTATVDSLPLISSSIMSKKLAAGARNLVLDIKVGHGAFLKTPEEARKLAHSMVSIGHQSGRRVMAFLTDMNTPLGYAVGNAPEVREAIAVLRGELGAPEDLRRVCLTLAAGMVSLARKMPLRDATAAVTDALHSGLGFAVMQRWIAAQGGDVRCLTEPSRLPTARYQEPVISREAGFVFQMDAEEIGRIAVILGAGRLKKGDPVSPAAGLILTKKPGDPVHTGDQLAILCTDNPASLPEAADRLLAAVSIRPTPPKKTPLIYGTVK